MPSQKTAKTMRSTGRRSVRQRPAQFGRKSVADIRRQAKRLTAEANALKALSAWLGERPPVPPGTIAMEIMNPILKGLRELLALVGKLAVCGGFQQNLDRLNASIEGGNLSPETRKQLEETGNLLWESMGDFGCPR